MKIYFLIFICIIAMVMGCQMVEQLSQKKSNIFEMAVESKDTHSIQIIKVELDEYLQAYLMSINFESKTKIIKTGEEKYIYVRGPIRKALGQDLSKATITAKFIDDEGNIKSEGISKVVPARTHTNRGLKGRFMIKALYDSSIVLCKLEIKWRGGNP